MPATESESDYHFDVDGFFEENFVRLTCLIASLGRGKSWDYFDPEDLVEMAVEKKASLAAEKFVLAVEKKAT